MPKNKQRTEKEIEEFYDTRLKKDLISALAGGKITGMEFIDKVAKLKKEKDAAILTEAREIPKLQAPKAVGLKENIGSRRQGVN